MSGSTILGGEVKLEKMGKLSVLLSVTYCPKSLLPLLPVPPQTPMQTLMTPADAIAS